MFSIIFRNKDISYGVALIRVVPLRTADCVKWLQLNFFAIRTFLREWLCLGHLPSGWQIGFSDYSSIFFTQQIFLETNRFDTYLLFGYTSQCPANLMLLHVVVIFREFFAIKTFVTEWLCLGHFPNGWQIGFSDYSSIFYPTNILETNRSDQYLPL